MIQRRRQFWFVIAGCWVVIGLLLAQDGQWARAILDLAMGGICILEGKATCDN